MALTGPQLVKLAQDAGLDPARARIAAAIAIAESGGRPEAHNRNPATKDDSYGLWQVNLDPQVVDPNLRMRQIGITNPNELLDPATNARAMAQISGNGKSWTQWSTYNNAFRSDGSIDPDSAFAKALGSLGISTGSFKDGPGGIVGAATGIVDTATNLAGDAASAVGAVFDFVTGGWQQAVLKIVIVGAGVAAGLALLVAGGLKTVGVDRQDVAQVGQTAAMAAAV